MEGSNLLWLFYSKSETTTVLWNFYIRHGSLTILRGYRDIYWHIRVEPPGPVTVHSAAAASLQSTFTTDTISRQAVPVSADPLRSTWL